MLEKYEYSFVRELTEELQLAIRKENKFVVLAYDNIQTMLVMQKVAWAFEKRSWRKLTAIYREAFRFLEEQHFKLRRCRMDLFKWDVLGKNFGLDIQPDLLKRIRWPEQSLREEWRDENYVEYHGGDISDEDSDENSDDDDSTDHDEDAVDD